MHKHHSSANEAVPKYYVTCSPVRKLPPWLPSFRHPCRRGTNTHFGRRSPFRRLLRQPWVHPHGVGHGSPPHCCPWRPSRRELPQTLDANWSLEPALQCRGVALLSSGERNTVLGPALKFPNINYLNKLSANKLESENSSQKLYGEL